MLVPQCVVLLRVVFLLMASFSSLPAAPRVDALPVPASAVDEVLGSLPDQSPNAVVLKDVNGADAPSATVRTFWNDHTVFFVFQCADEHVVSSGREDGLDHFRLGDTVEVFIGRRGRPGYAEIHATPAGKKTLYFFDSYRSRGETPAEARRVRVDAATTHLGWRAVIAVPWSALGGTGPEGEWEIFFGRYDYDAEGSAPKLSSFPPQRGAKPDFHRRADYAILHFVR